MLRLIIHGINGRMGRVLQEAVKTHDDHCIVAGVDKVAGATPDGIPVYDRLSDVEAQADVLIDFTHPDALPDILSFAAERKLSVVLATTGYTAADITRIERAANRIAIFRSANMSLGVNLLIDLAQKCATFLDRDCDVEIIEAHHRYKADAPSGTALMVADAINKIYQDEKSYTYGRHDRSGRRTNNEIGIHSVRGGTTVGDHAVQFLMNDELIEVRHSAQSRTIFAMGALRAAQFVAGRDPGFYNMRDLLLDKSAVTHVKVERRVAMITLTGLSQSPEVMSAVFRCMAERDINLDMISQTPQRFGQSGLSFSLSEERGAAAMAALKAEFAEAEVHLTGAQVKLTVHGLGMERQSGVAARVFELMQKLGVMANLVTTSLTEISLLVDMKDEFVLTDALTRAFDI